MKVTTLDKVVHNVLMQNGESTMNNYQKYLQFAIRGFRVLNLQAHTVIKVKHIPLADNKSIDIPSDMVKYTRIASCEDGRIITYAENNDLCLPREKDDCGELKPIEGGNSITNGGDTTDINNLNFGYTFLPHYHNGQFTAGIFGAGGGYHGQGYYRVDEELGKIWFSSDITADKVILEYVSDGLSPDGTASVPIEAEEAIIAFIDWKIAEHDKKTPDGRAERKRTLFAMEKKNYRHRKVMFTIAEYLDTMRGLTDAMPKR